MSIDEAVEAWRKEFDRENRRAEFDEADLRKLLKAVASGELTKFRNSVNALLRLGVGPGGGYYSQEQRLQAAVSLLDCGWGSLK